VHIYVHIRQLSRFQPCFHVKPSYICRILHMSSLRRDDMQARLSYLKVHICTCLVTSSVKTALYI